MANFADYLDSRRGAASALARQVGISKGTLSSIRTGKSRPSPELAKKIEQATDGEVTAASLLGLESGAAARSLRLDARRWLIWTGDRGGAPVPLEVLEDLGVEPGEAIAFRKSERGWEVTSVKNDMRGVQERTSKFARPGVSVVDELIAERRAEAARE
jgi:transcriptional regulator with XRE-family HTH domain